MLAALMLSMTLLSTILLVQAVTSGDTQGLPKSPTTVATRLGDDQTQLAVVRGR
jgi:hypothetical protein